MLKRVKKVIVVSDDAPLYVKPGDQSRIEDVPIEVSIDSELTYTERAMKHFGLAESNIFRLKDYADKIVIVTIDGRKLTWPKSIS